MPDAQTTAAQAAAIETPPEADQGPVEPAAPPADLPAPAVPSSMPVELPPVEQMLDADLEAELEEALASEELSAPAAVTPVAEETPEQAPPPPVTEDALQRGTKLRGRIQSIHGEDVFLDLGFRSPGVVPARQFDTGKKPIEGQVIEVVVDRLDQQEGLIHLNLPRGLRRVSGNWEALAPGQVVDCMVVKTNKGGLQVNVGNIRGFMPASQVDLGFVSDLDQFIGQKLRAQVVEVNPRKRNLVVSRRAWQLEERKAAEEELWKKIAVGQTYTGTVKTIKDYGAFVDIGGGIDGFLHVSEMSWTRVRHPSDLLTVGQEVDVQVLSLDVEKKKISLGLKQLVPNPWADAEQKYAAGKTVSGRVTRTTDFGAFVELEPGVEGLVHISELDHKRVRKVTDVLQEGQEVTVQVLNVDPQRQRVSLSLKALQEKPAGDDRRQSEPGESGPPSTRRGRGRRLKGGTGAQVSGGLFGNPDDFR